MKLDPDDRDGELGLRPDQVVAVLHAAVLGLTAECRGLGDRLAALEAPAT